jgi:hypothetical protein
MNGAGKERMGLVDIIDIAFGDLNNDGKIDAAVLLSVQGGASATMDQVAVVINNNGNIYHIASVLLVSHIKVKTFFIKN